MFKLGLSALILLSFNFAFSQAGVKITEVQTAESSPDFAKADPGSEAQTEYVFKTHGSKKEGSKIIGRLKFVEMTSNVRLEFSGSNLQKGSYKIYKIDDCDTFKKAKSKSSAGEDYFTFETKYGDISDEKNLTFAKVKDLNLEGKSFALLKVSGKTLTLVACSEK